MTNETGESGITPTESETTRTVGNPFHGSRETPAASAIHSMIADRSEKARRHKSDMHAAGESDGSIVPGKPANKDGAPPSAESAEGRGPTEENARQSLLRRTPRRMPEDKPPNRRSRGLLGVREAARKRAVHPSLSKVGAVCGSSAHTDLRGRRSETTVPTAIIGDLLNKHTG